MPQFVLYIKFTLDFKFNLYTRQRKIHSKPFYWLLLLLLLLPTYYYYYYYYYYYHYLGIRTPSGTLYAYKTKRLQKIINSSFQPSTILKNDLPFRK